MGNLTVAKMQMVEIAKAVSYDSKVIIMDEPTSSLTQTEVEQLFRIIEDLKARNVAVIYISHKMEEIFHIADEVTVLRDGAHIATEPVSALDVDKLVALMVGRDPDVPPNCPVRSRTILKVENLSSGRQVRNVSFELPGARSWVWQGLWASRTSDRYSRLPTEEKSSKRWNSDRSPEDAIKHGSPC